MWKGEGGGVRVVECVCGGWMGVHVGCMCEGGVCKIEQIERNQNEVIRQHL